MRLPDLTAELSLRIGEMRLQTINHVADLGQEIAKEIERQLGAVTQEQMRAIVDAQVKQMVEAEIRRQTEQVAREHVRSLVQAHLNGSKDYLPYVVTNAVAEILRR